MRFTRHRLLLFHGRSVAILVFTAAACLGVRSEGFASGRHELRLQQATEFMAASTCSNNEGRQRLRAALMAFRTPVGALDEPAE